MAHPYRRAASGVFSPVSIAAVAAVLACAAPGLAQDKSPPTAPGGPDAPAKKSPDWVALEAPLLTGHVQLTSRDRFVKAGEAYFNPDASWIIFQAVPVPALGQEPDPVYSMYVARLVIVKGEVVGIDEPILISEPGSANTCGWFHPENIGRVIFGSTLVRPQRQERPGFRVGTNRYEWAFPEETEVVTRMVAPIFEERRADSLRFIEGGLANKKRELAELERFAEARRRKQPGEEAAEVLLDRFELAKRAECKQQIEAVEQWIGEMKARDPAEAPDAGAARVLFARPDYDAECSYSADGRFVLYSHVEKRNPDGTADADIWVYDTQTGLQHAIVQAPGYDGGPFFSPDGQYIAYRSDRKGDNLLQLFIGKLRRDSDGVPIGLEWERALTDNGHVNWCPFWHPSGEFVVYATSEVGHHNYEVFAARVDGAFLDGSVGPAGVRRTRVTRADGADILPVFSTDGAWMMWTAQRGPMTEGESKPSSQIWVARVGGGMNTASLFASQDAPHEP